MSASQSSPPGAPSANPSLTSGTPLGAPDNRFSITNNNTSSANNINRRRGILSAFLSVGVLIGGIFEVVDQNRLAGEMNSRRAVPGRTINHNGTFGRTSFGVVSGENGCIEVSESPRATGLRLVADTITKIIYNNVVAKCPARKIELPRFPGNNQG